MLELFSWGAEGWGDELLKGTLVTLAASVLAFALGCGFGTLGALVAQGRSRFGRFAVYLYTTLIRGVPELLVIYLFFFGGSQLLAALASAFGLTDKWNPNAFTAGVLAIGVVAGAYATEVMRGALRAVDKGQVEAARAFGWRGAGVFRRVILPQALRIALPGLGNVWLLTLKDTALVSVTGLVEIMRVANVATGSTRMPLQFYGAALVLYLLLSGASNGAFAALEKRLGRGVRSPAT